MKISIVSPVYLGEKLVPQLVERLKKSLAIIGGTYEIILVEDGSPDNSWEAIQKVCENDATVKGIQLSRNFGQHYAITAGLERAQGEWIVVMDCDLQDQPEEISKLLEKANEGFDIVYAQRKIRHDSFFKILSSKIFYSIFAYLTDTKQDSSVANFGVYNRKVINAVLSMNDYTRYFPTMIQWVGFNSAKVTVKHASRIAGSSSYSWRKLTKLALNNIIAFSDKPLKLTIRLGFTLSILSFITGLIYLYQYSSGRIKVMGYTSIIVAITFSSGLIISTLGLIGLYLGKTFDQTKQRPIYIVGKTLNIDA